MIDFKTVERPEAPAEAFDLCRSLADCLNLSELFVRLPNWPTVFGQPDKRLISIVLSNQNYKLWLVMIMDVLIGSGLDEYVEKTYVENLHKAEQNGKDIEPASPHPICWIEFAHSNRSSGTGFSV